MEHTAVGINHLTWFTDVTLDGEDAMPRLQEKASKALGGGINADTLGRYFAEGGNLAEDQAGLPDWPFFLELTKLLGALPAPGDRHIVEFFPHMFSGEHDYYGKTLGIDSYSFESCIELGQSIFEEMQAIALSSDPLPDDFLTQSSGEHEQACDIVESIRTNAGGEYNANLPNLGQIPNLPQGAVVECPVIADATGIHPRQTKPLPAAIVGTLADRFQWVEVTVEAALEGSRDKFIEALLIDGSVGSVETACSLADELLEAQKEYLPQF